ALDKPGKGGAFREGHFARRLVEITAGRRLCAIEPAAEIDPVQIELHDFLFREIVLDPPGDEHLEQLAAKSLALEFETVARELLGDGARSLPHVTGDGVFDRR